MMSEISKEVRKTKNSPEEKSSKARPRASSTRTDVNKLTTSKETNISFFLGYCKFVNIISKRFRITTTVVIY